MKCHEFMEAAELLTPAQLMQAQNERQPLWEHAQECASCGRWVDSKRLLDNALATLRNATAQRQAGPQTDIAVLNAFRTQGFAPKAVTMPERPAPAMFKLSRFFEVGAYAAVAAALIVGLFLGSRILRDKQIHTPEEQARTTSAPEQHSIQASGAQANDGQAGNVAATEKALHAAVVEPAALKMKQLPGAKVKVDTAAADQAGYVAVMLCDPLICSGDEQVVRMELPATVTTDPNSSQPVLADVVIGDDGLVRAMRIVHE